MTKRKNKNISHKIGDGRTIQTRDEYLEGGKGYSKTGYENKGFYRMGTIVGSNSKDELAIAKGTSKGKHSIPSLNKGKTKYKPVVITKDENGNPLKIGKKVILNKKKKSASKKILKTYKKGAFLIKKQKMKRKIKIKIK